ncbi:MAG TPA: glutamate-5-semialdehyde dehydrogenase [Armatimonadaceae bacterium]|nr:glutamate-5-semialdehyde dehydrogenase [Armatimonadaceae bacterium]
MGHSVTLADAAVLSEVEGKAEAAQNASRRLAAVGAGIKNAALEAMAEALDRKRVDILEANARDVAAARDNGVAPHMVDRLVLHDKRIDAMRDGLLQIVALPDPVGGVVEGWRRPNGLQISKVRVPIGVIGIIYESRPNVTVDAASLCLKAGNAVVLRGGSEAIHSNIALTRVISSAAEKVGIPAGAIGLIETTDRAAVRHLMTLNRYVDCLIPRGGASLIETVVRESTVPVIETGTGNCHVYVDKHADPEMAERIILNAKCSRPSVCNAAETLLFHDQPTYLPLIGILMALQERGVEVRGCDRTRRIAEEAQSSYKIKPVVPATEDDYYAEFNDMIIAVRIVDSLDAAIAHINQYGSRHSEAIVTRDYAASQKFCDEVDAAAVYVNASTRFTDGYEFGFGAEIGISNQKLHARGPMGLNELTTTKYVVRGHGQVR